MPLVTRALVVEHDRAGIRRSTRRFGARNHDLLSCWLYTNPVLLEARHAALLQLAVTELSELAQLRDVATTGASTSSRTLAGGAAAVELHGKHVLGARTTLWPLRVMTESTRERMHAARNYMKLDHDVGKIPIMRCERDKSAVRCGF